mgnify:CR=1 FL=1
MSKSDFSSDDECDIEYQCNSELENMFPITYFDVNTKSNRKCSMFLLGDTISNHTRIAIKQTVSSLKALEEYLTKSESEGKFHDISPKMLDSLFQSQKASSQLFNNCMKLIDEINTNF